MKIQAFEMCRDGHPIPLKTFYKENLIIILREYNIPQGPLALDGAVIQKISKRHFFQDIQNSFHGVTQMGLEPHQKFFQKLFSTNMVARGV